MTDDYTYFTVVSRLENKHELFKNFQEHEAMVTAYFKRKISRLHCDNAKKYVFKGYLTYRARDN